MKKLISMVLALAVVLSMSMSVFADEVTKVGADNMPTANNAPKTIQFSRGAEQGTAISKASVTYYDEISLTYAFDVDNGIGHITAEYLNADGKTVTEDITVKSADGSAYYPKYIHMSGDQTALTGNMSFIGDEVVVVSYGFIGDPVEYTVMCYDQSGKVIGESRGYTRKAYKGDEFVAAPQIDGYKLVSQDPANFTASEGATVKLVYAPLDTTTETTVTIVVPGGSRGTGTGTTSGSGTESGTTIPDESVPQGDGTESGSNSGTNSGTDIESESVPGGNQPGGQNGTKYIPAAAGGVGLLGLLLLLAKKKKESDEQPEG